MSLWLSLTKYKNMWYFVYTVQGPAVLPVKFRTSIRIILPAWRHQKCNCWKIYPVSSSWMTIVPGPISHSLHLWFLKNIVVEVHIDPISFKIHHISMLEENVLFYERMKFKWIGCKPIFWPNGCPFQFQPLFRIFNIFTFALHLLNYTKDRTIISRQFIYFWPLVILYTTMFVLQ